MTQWLYFVAITRMPIGIALLIEFTAPIMVVLWVRYAWHRPVRNTVWLGLALAMVGLAMVAQIWLGLTLNSLGVAAALGAAVALALYYLLGETCGQERDPVSLTLWGFGFAALMWAVLLPWWHYPWASLEGSATPSARAPQRSRSGRWPSGWWFSARSCHSGWCSPRSATSGPPEPASSG